MSRHPPSRSLSTAGQGCQVSFNAASKRFHRSATFSSPTEIRIRYRETPPQVVDTPATDGKYKAPSHRNG
jgi:hypothetical protein